MSNLFIDIHKGFLLIIDETNVSIIILYHLLTINLKHLFKIFT
jgi:hypothetical protein